jgi:hypothetical protein
MLLLKYIDFGYRNLLKQKRNETYDDRLTNLPDPISMRNELVKSRHVLLIMFFHNLDGFAIGFEDNIPAVIELF